MSGMSPSTPANVPRWQDIPGIEYEPITQRRTSRTYPYQCRRCGAPATWRETLESRDHRRFRVPWCICDRCYQAATGEHTGNQYTMERGNNFPLPKTAERIAEQSTSLTGRETKKEEGGDLCRFWTLV